MQQWPPFCCPSVHSSFHNAQLVGLCACRARRSPQEQPHLLPAVFWSNGSVASLRARPTAGPGEDVQERPTPLYPSPVDSATRHLPYCLVPAPLQGQEKMSKSDPNSAIFMEDTEQEVKTKIKKAYCPPQQVSSDVVL